MKGSISNERNREQHIFNPSRPVHFWKFLTTLIRTLTHTYQGIKIVNFSVNFAYVLMNDPLRIFPEFIWGHFVEKCFDLFLLIPSFLTTSNKDVLYCLLSACWWHVFVVFSSTELVWQQYTVNSMTSVLKKHCFILYLIFFLLRVILRFSRI